MNELLFFFHCLLMMSAVLGALALGPQALVAFVCWCSILANIFVVKQISLFGLEVTSSDVYMIGAVCGLNLLQEFYGRSIARKTIGISFFLMVLYLVVSQLHLLFVPSVHDTMHSHLAMLLQPMPRIIISSVVVYVLVQHIDYYWYGFLKNLTKGRWLVGRNVLSLIISQLIDTVLFSFAALYGIVASIGEVIFFSFVVKTIVIALSAPFLAMSGKLVNRVGLVVGATVFEQADAAQPDSNHPLTTLKQEKS